MLIASKKVSVSIPPLDAGVYQAIVVGLVDLGEQYSQLYKKAQNRVALTFEIAGEMVEVDGENKPRWLSKEYTMSTDKKANLRKLTEACLGRELSAAEEDEYDLRGLVGRGCQITVKRTEKDGRVYNDVGEAMALAKGTRLAAPQSDTFVFDMDAPDAKDAYLLLPEWIRKKIEVSPTWQKKTACSEEFEMPAPRNEPRPAKDDLPAEPDF